MTLQQFITKHRPRIARELSRATAFSQEYTNPWALDVEARYGSMEGGKALRAILTLIGYESTRKPLNADVFHLAVTIELLHATLLIHDDIVDRDDLRRGVASLFSQYRALAGSSPEATHIGIGMALCAGDVGLLHASGRLSQLAAKSRHGAKAALLVSRYCIETGFGEMEDFAYGMKMASPDEKAILRMLINKTARYSCSMPLAAGAQLGGASAARVQAFEDIGEDLGLIFQLRDDELGVFGTTEQLGKPAGSDIREGKQTLFALYLRSACTPDELQRSDAIFGNPAAQEKDFAYIRDLMRHHAIDKKVSRLVTRLEKRARTRIEALAIPTSTRQLLLETLAYVSRRTT